MSRVMRVFVETSPGSTAEARYFPPSLLKIPVPLPGSDEPMWSIHYYVPVDDETTVGFWYSSRRA